MQYETLYNLLPVEEEGKMVLGLDTMNQLMDLLDRPETKVPIIHIAGTNGKGSTASYISTVLEAAGYRVGLFTSPSLVEFNERIRVNQRAISDEDLFNLAKQIKERVEKENVRFTEFELFTALAYLNFEQEQCDVAILEVGLGGRLDATNVIEQPELTIITKIALDHQTILGNTLGKIAAEKAGIIKQNVPLVLYPQPSLGAGKVIREKAATLNAELNAVKLKELSYELNIESKQSFQYKNESYEISLLEEHQIKNAAVAIEALQTLQNKGWNVTNRAIKEGLARTEWPARFEWISKRPDIIIDGSHNNDGVKELAKNLNRYFKTKKKIAIVGMLGDKDTTKSLEVILPLFKEVITVAPNSPRALSAKELAEQIKEQDLFHLKHIHVADTLEEAYEKGLSMTQNDEMICIFGSTYYVGLMREIIMTREEM